MESQTMWEISQDVRQQWLLHKDKVGVIKSKISGYGLVAKTALYRDDFSLEYVGEWKKVKSDHNKYQLQHSLDGEVIYFITPLGSDDEDEQRRDHLGGGWTG